MRMSPGIVHLDANFGGAQIRIEHWAYIADGPVNLIGISGQADIRFFAEMHIGQIIFIDVAKNPDVERSEMVNGLGEASPATPAALVTC